MLQLASNDKLSDIAKELSGFFAQEPVHLADPLYLRNLVKKKTGNFLKMKEVESLIGILKKDYGLLQKKARIKNGDLSKLAGQLVNRGILNPGTETLFRVKTPLELYTLVKKNFGTKLNFGKIQKLVSILHLDHGVETYLVKKKKTSK